MFDDLLSMNISEVRFVAFDTETTGIDTRDHIVEIAALSFDEEFEQRRYSSFMKCPVPIPPEVIALHGITDDMVRDAPSPTVVMDQFFDFLKFTGTPRVCVAHNSSFDVGMVHRTLERSKMNQGDRPFEFVIDSCHFAKTILPDLPKHSLSVLAQHFKITPPEQYHRAMADVEILRKVFLNLLCIAADKFSGPEGLTIARVVELACGYYIMSPQDSEYRKNSFIFSPMLELISQYCGTDAALGILYGDGDDSMRYITPLAIYRKGFKIYVEALCHEDNVQKKFRADRIKKVTLAQ